MHIYIIVIDISYSYVEAELNLYKAMVIYAFNGDELEYNVI